MTHDEILHEFELYYAANYGDPCTGDMEKEKRRDVWLAAVEMYRRHLHQKFMDGLTPHMREDL